MSTYTKPHLTYAQQLDLIENRGATCSDEAKALHLLQALGYYNLTGYLYPYRQPGPVEGIRGDSFEKGTSLDDVATLVSFDRELRICLLDGIQQTELAIRARIAYTLGERDPFGHVHQRSLDAKACARTYPRAGRTRTAFDWWIDEYKRLQERARREPFVGHNLTKYGEPLPVWVACEFFDFGAVSNLYQLLTYADRQTIAEQAGISAERTLRSWLTSLNHARNICAHSQRLWNRILTVKPNITPRDLSADLHHLTGSGNQKPYATIAITAYLLQHLNPDTDWTRRMRTLLESFPAIPMRSIEELGAPDHWEDQRLWTDPEAAMEGVRHD